MPTLVEIKAKCTDPQNIHQILKAHNADFKGIDHQVDTYFVVPKGRLKLREGNIENTLIHYHRPNQEGPKTSAVSLYRPDPDGGLKKVLSTALDTLVTVDKKRAIYFIDHIKFHVDEVKDLGSFMEIEVIDEQGEMSLEVMEQQCQYWMQKLAVEKQDLIESSYSDLLMNEQNG